MEFLGIPSYGSENVDEEMVMKRGDFDYRPFTPSHFTDNDFVHIQQSIFKDDYEDVNLCEKVLIETSQESYQDVNVGVASGASNHVLRLDLDCDSTSTPAAGGGRTGSCGGTLVAAGDLRPLLPLPSNTTGYLATDIDAAVVVEALSVCAEPLPPCCGSEQTTSQHQKEEGMKMQQEGKGEGMGAFPQEQAHLDKVHKKQKKSHKTSPAQNKQKFKCEECSKTYGTPQSLEVHTRIHRGERRFHCVECSKSFITAGNLKAHMRVHSGEKPYKCTNGKCDQSFAERNTLKKHMLTHSGLKPYTCSICQRSYSQVSSRNVHMRKNHSNNSIVINNRLMKNTSQDNNMNKTTIITINENF